MRALVNTKSNFRDLNGKWVKIRQFLGSIVYCEFYCEESKQVIKFDLAMAEIKEIKEDKNDPI